MENEIGNSDIVALAEELSGIPRDSSVKREKDGSRSRQKKSPAILWKELKCGKGSWDPKTEHAAIGTDPESEYDQVRNARARK